ncbi:hypothetical protein A3H40_04330 [Candidatus Daviesbacteria bacterium RIFCSPLOWO2_02_FULL_38_15]|uniref:Coenzyme F420:L-glutamate ligase-like domain-containing protein n=1 Tax=Candidatus Daviesbacteria bacterium RIFCSPLOWO2_02_FULL_38_15 TaxID=1797794 RepID=A0A1F5N482_9BACT|nr:MAG: hypothetical protein A3H40_04330 [Candidatus Daviesbacteria bacterium RIFCSPLOWO2_02_FULL_38_15]
MLVQAIKTRKFLPPKDNLWELLSANIKILNESSVVAVTSKVVSISEGRCIPFSEITKDELAIKEADKYIPREMSPGGWILHTIKNNMLIASSGVDESNGANYYILWPEKPQRSAKKIWEFLRKKFRVKNLGIIITDSRLIPLRRGVVGIAIGYFGLKPLKDYRGTPDLFGREFRMETSNLADSLATAAVLEMGEGAESQPIAIISDVPDLKFSTKDESNALTINEKEDMFYPFLFSVKWKKGKSGRY